MPLALADYESPYYQDMVGLDLSLYQVQKLMETNSKNEMLPNDDSSPSKVRDTWTQLGQAALKFKFGTRADMKVGRMTHNSQLLKSTYSRAVMDSFSGVAGNAYLMDGLRVYGAVYDAWLPRSGDQFSRFVARNTLTGPGSQPGDIEYVAIYGLQYKSGPYQFDLESLNSKNYIQKYAAVGAYTMPLSNKNSLKLSGGVATSKDAGSAYTCGSFSEIDRGTLVATSTACSNNAVGTYLDAEWKTGNWSLGAAIAQFNGLWIEDNFAVKNVGRFGTNITDHGTSFFPTASVSGNDMTNNGEVARAVRVFYDWKDWVPGLTTAYRYRWGTGALNSYNASLGSGTEGEREYDVAYNPPQLKGVSFRYNYLEYIGDVSGALNGITAGGSKGFRVDHRIYANYTYRFF